MLATPILDFEVLEVSAGRFQAEVFDAITGRIVFRSAIWPLDWMARDEALRIIREGQLCN